MLMERPRSCKSYLIARLAICCKYLQKTLSPENNNLELQLSHSMPPVQPHCWPLSILFLSYHSIAIIRPDHPFIVDISATWYRFNWHFPGGIFICLPSDGLYLLFAYTPIDSYIFLFSTNVLKGLRVTLYHGVMAISIFTFLLHISITSTFHS